MKEKNYCLIFLDSVYDNVEYADGFIYFEDEDTGNRYKVAVYTTN